MILRLPRRWRAAFVIYRANDPNDWREWNPTPPPTPPAHLPANVPDGFAIPEKRDPRDPR